MKAPAPGLVSLRREVDKLFDRLWDGDWERFPFVGEWMPALDLTENKDSITVRLDVPGMEPKDIHVNLQENVLTIRGEKKVEKEETSETFYRSERQHGSFTRTVRLPAGVDGTKVNATFKNGVLSIVMPKVPEAKGTEIPIKIT
jgi:HSP20 family protein